MNTQIQTRTISTTADITLHQDGTAPLLVTRELVMDEDTDGSWLVYAVVPESVDDTGEGMASGSIRVTDEAGKRLLGKVFSMLADPASSRSRTR
jgi:hypothetical protein